MNELRQVDNTKNMPGLMETRERERERETVAGANLQPAFIRELK
jgi:hypothetical protein